jgi:hypothetical protein
MNYSDRHLERLFHLARQAPPLLTAQGTNNLLEYADHRRVALSALAFLSGHGAVATAAITAAIGVATVIMSFHSGNAPGRTANGTHEMPGMARVAIEAIPMNPLPAAFSPAAPEVQEAGHVATRPDRGGASGTALAGVLTADASTDVSTVGIDGALVLPVGMSAAPAVVREPFDHKQSPGTFLPPSFAEQRIMIFLEGGSMMTGMSGGLRNASAAGRSAGAPQNFGAANGEAGSWIAAGVSAPITEWLRATCAVHVASYAARYHSPDVEFVSSTTNGEKPMPIQVSHNAVLNIGTISLVPGVRLTPILFPVYFDAGIAAGVVYRRTAAFSTTDASHAAQGAVHLSLPAAVTDYAFGRTRVQWDLQFALGAEIPVTQSVSLDVALRGQYGLVPLFADNYPRAYSVTPEAGVRFALP